MKHQNDKAKRINKNVYINQHAKLIDTAQGLHSLMSGDNIKMQALDGNCLLR
jgi:hypothetical protein